MSVFFSGIAQLRPSFFLPGIYNFLQRIFLALMLLWLSGCTANVYFHPPEDIYLVQPEVRLKQDRQP